MVAVLASYAARFSVRAHDVTVDATLLWVGAGLAIAAAVLLAFVPRLPSADAANGMGLASGGARLTSGTNRRLRVFAVTQIAASFVLVAGAGMLITTLFALQRQQTGFNGNVLAVNVPVVSYTRKPEEVSALLQGSHPPDLGAAGRGTAWRSAPSCRGAIPASSPRSSRPRATRRRTARRIRARGSAPCRRDSSTRSASG